MLHWLLQIDPAREIAGVNVFFRGSLWVTVPLSIAAVAVVIYLYRSEPSLSRTRRTIMAVCLALALATLIGILARPAADIQLVEPYRRTMLILLDTSQSMAWEDQRTAPADVVEAARILGKIPFDRELTDGNVEELQRQVGPPQRLELATAALAHPDIRLIEELRAQYNVRFFSFDDQLRAEGGESPDEWLKSCRAEGSTSRVGSAIREAVARYTGQAIAGVVVLSDFASVEGEDPVKVARELKEQGIPVHTVPIGLPAPKDIHVQRVIAPEVVFKGDRVPVRIQIESRGYEGTVADLSLTVAGQPVTSDNVVLKEGVQYEELMFLPRDQSGSVDLEVKVRPQADETNSKNNSLTHNVRIIDEKIKVLYIEGMPRWEYRYLRWVLLRDPRLEVSFLMTQGDPALADASPRHRKRFPEDVKDAMQFDLVILGDVPASTFNANQLRLLDDLVKKSGGSLLMIAGPMAAPRTYRDSPVETMLPVHLGSGQWEAVTSDVHPVVTPAGKESAVTSLSLSGDANQRIWSLVRPMHALPQLGGAKPGATVLLSLPKAAEQVQDYPLVSWHRYGNGKTMFVATEDLWRMRLEVGDRYHARFWGQAIQFLALSRLLGQNKQITVETERREYHSGEYVRVYANVLTESFEPVEQPSYTVVLQRQGTVDSAAELELTPVPGTAGLYSGAHLATEDGTYLLRTQADDAAISNQSEFQVSTVALEDRVTAMQADVGRQVAELSGGTRRSLTELAELPEQLGQEKELSTIVRTQFDLWDKPLLFLLIVGFAGTEWYLRRKNNLV